MPSKPAFSQAELEAVAKKRGYRSYNHMITVMRNGLPRSKQDGAGAQPQANILQRLWNNPKAALKDAFAWHPTNTIGHATAKMRRAQER